MARYLEHPSKCARWNNGVLEVYPDAAAAEETVWFIAESDSSGGDLWEGLLAHPLTASRARVAAVPAFVYGLGLGDEVEVSVSSDGSLVGVQELADAGMQTFRVALPDRPARAEEHEYGQVEALIADLRAWDTVFDIYSPQLVALSVGPRQADDFREFLESSEASSRFEYEHSKTQRPK
jgi:hypothetical protein